MTKKSFICPTFPLKIPPSPKSPSANLDATRRRRVFSFPLTDQTGFSSPSAPKNGSPGWRNHPFSVRCTKFGNTRPPRGSSVIICFCPTICIYFVRRAICISPSNAGSHFGKTVSPRRIPMSELFKRAVFIIACAMAKVTRRNGNTCGKIPFGTSWGNDLKTGLTLAACMKSIGRRIEIGAARQRRPTTIWQGRPAGQPKLPAARTARRSPVAIWPFFGGPIQFEIYISASATR